MCEDAGMNQTSRVWVGLGLVAAVTLLAMVMCQAASRPSSMGSVHVHNRTAAPISVVVLAMEGPSAGTKVKVGSRGGSSGRVSVPPGERRELVRVEGHSLELTKGTIVAIGVQDDKTLGLKASVVVDVFSAAQASNSNELVFVYEGSVFELIAGRDW
jgi:hypothetical protein